MACFERVVSDADWSLNIEIHQKVADDDYGKVVESGPVVADVHLVSDIDIGVSSGNLHLVVFDEASQVGSSGLDKLCAVVGLEVALGADVDIGTDLGGHGHGTWYVSALNGLGIGGPGCHLVRAV